MPGDVNVRDVFFFPVGVHTELTLNGVTDLIDTKPAGATKIMFQSFVQPIRFTIDGSAPSATKGFQLNSGDPAVILPVTGLNNVKVIEEVAGAILQYQWGK